MKTKSSNTIVHSQFVASIGIIGVLAGCAPVEEQATLSVKAQIASDLAALSSATRAIRDAAPIPDADGWNPTADAAAVQRMKTAWRQARDAYERVEGAIAVLFPETDVAIDERLDGLVAERPDPQLFDGEGVTGMHAVERILWADAIPARVQTFEAGLANAPAPARTPANMQEATDFRAALVGRLIRDCEEMERQFRPLALDNAAAFRGVVSSLEEQIEKTSRAATAEEESRYSQQTLADMRANLAGGRRTFMAFRPWLESRGGAAVGAQINARFVMIENHYANLRGDSLPEVPAGFNAEAPSAEHLATPYGQLTTLLAHEADGAQPDSLVALMNQAATLMNLPELRR